MDRESAKYEEAARIRSHYNEAISEAYKVYYESEEIAAYLVLEIFRLQNLRCESESEEIDRSERLSEKTGVLDRTKQTMHFILDRLHEWARDRDNFVSDIYTSTRIVDLESKLSNLTPWLDDLLIEVERKAEAAKLDAKITSEIARARYTP
jgi:hypothetical protein